MEGPVECDRRGLNLPVVCDRRAHSPKGPIHARSRDRRRDPHSDRPRLPWRLQSHTGADTGGNLFSFTIPTPGAYPFRMAHYNGGTDSL